MSDQALLAIPRYIAQEINKNTAPLLARINELEQRIAELERTVAALQPPQPKPSLMARLVGRAQP